MDTNRNLLHDISNEQRKALAQCFFLGVRPGEILLRTPYALLEPTGAIALTPRARQDFQRLIEEGLTVDPVSGAVVKGVVGFMTKTQTMPFNEAEEQRIRQIVEEVLGYAFQRMMETWRDA